NHIVNFSSASERKIKEQVQDLNNGMVAQLNENSKIDDSSNMNFVLEKINFFQSKVQKLNQSNKKRIREKNYFNRRFIIPAETTE
ncbi:1732_t:CDS:2, partial [Racocetra fulgida]